MLTLLVKCQAFFVPKMAYMQLSRVVHLLLDFTLTDPDVRRYRIRLFQAGNLDQVLTILRYE